jgi:hypothetical protein
MPEKKLLLTDKTQFTEVRAFFDGLDDKDRVRARSCEDGVELYVRGSSKWHVFTDLLRLASDVQKDYKKASDKLFSIFSSSANGPLSNIRYDLPGLKKNTAEHKHDFRAVQLKSFFNSSANFDRSVHHAGVAAMRKNRSQREASERLNLAWDNVNLNLSDQQSIQQYVQDFVVDKNRSDTRENAVIQSQADEFSKYLDIKINKADNSQEPDYVAAELFAFSLKQRLEGNSLTASDEAAKTQEQAVMSLLSTITEQSVPSQVNLNAGDVGFSEADLIIVDPHSSYRGQIAMTMSSTSRSESHTATYRNGDEPINFSITDHQEIRGTNSAKIDNALEIRYDEGFPNRRDALKALYDQVGETIATKISSSGKQSGDPYTIHMTILNPDEAGLARQDTTDALEAFAIATLQWLKDHPNLRIKVQLPQGVSEQAMIDVYRKCKYY